MMFLCFSLSLVFVSLFWLQHIFYLVACAVSCLLCLCVCSVLASFGSVSLGRGCACLPFRIFPNVKIHWTQSRTEGVQRSQTKRIARHSHRQQKRHSATKQFFDDAQRSTTTQLAIGNRRTNRRPTRPVRHSASTHIFVNGGMLCSTCQKSK